MHPHDTLAPRRATVCWHALLLTLGLLALGGCASVYRVDNAVDSYARWGGSPAEAGAKSPIPQPPQTYRFDRLPSQNEGRKATGQDQLEQLARNALGKVGWRQADAGAAPSWTVQVSASSLRLPHAPWEDPWDRHWGGFGMFGRGHAISGSGHIVWSPMFLHTDWPYYKRKVSLLISHAGSGQVVYETNAAHEGRWNSTPELWGAMLDAALQGFPTPPEGTRQVNIDLPR